MFDPQSRQTLAVLAMFWLLVPTSIHAGVPRYTVATDQRLEHLDVKACFDRLPRRLTARNEGAARLLHDVRLHSQQDVIEVSSEGLDLLLPLSETPGCVHYRVDLSTIGHQQWRSGNWRTRDAIILDPGWWLWLAEDIPEDQPWRLDFELPPGYDVSTPWKRIRRDRDTVTYEVRERMPERDARMAIGRFSVESIDLAGGRIRSALLPGQPDPDTAAMRRWVTSNARALVTTYGSLPVADLQLLVVPIGRGGEPVPWGEVQRGGGDAVHLYIDQRRSERAFMDDWVLVHELSHLLHPVIISEDRWLSEGIASYYQNVLRARAGMKSAESAWNKLHAGFERGIQGTPRGRSLAEVSETMMQDRSFMRVYWSGAALALLADVELRQRSGGAQSLDTALAALRDCCLPADRSWTAHELMHRLDRLTGTEVFMGLYRTHVDSDEFPDLTGVYAELGLKPISATRLRLDPTAPGATICASIMASPDG